MEQVRPNWQKISNIGETADIVQSASPSAMSPEPPIFIVGCMRSGTSLVSHVLDSHSRVAIFYESYLYNYFRSELRYYGDLNERSNLHRLIESVRQAITAQKAVPPTADEIEAALPSRTFPGIFGTVLHLYARAHGKYRAGDKTPDHHFHLHQIARDFPRSPIVFLMRDPRDTVLSLCNAFGATIEAGAHAWNEAFSSYSKGNSLVHLLRYEELACAPQSTIETLCQGIGETYEPEMLRFFERVPTRLRAEKQHEKLTRPIDASSVGTFRQLPSREIETIERICAEGMEALNYSFAKAPKSGASFSSVRPPFLQRTVYRLRYYGFHPFRWKAGLVRWKMMCWIRLRYWFSLGLLLSICRGEPFIDGSYLDCFLAADGWL